MNFTDFGIRRLLRGLRTGDQKVIALGLGALALALLRRPKKRTLLLSQRMERGDEYVVKLNSQTL